jgi:hypothetical protein
MSTKRTTKKTAGNKKTPVKKRAPVKKAPVKKAAIKKTTAKKKAPLTKPTRKKSTPVQKTVTNNDTVEDNDFIEDGTKLRLKNKINSWMDHDDKIKKLTSQIKNHKDAKKEGEDAIMRMILQLNMEDAQIDVRDDKQQLRGRVYRYRSVTKGTLKESIIKEVLMETMRDEYRVDQLVKKIEEKRPINERYYLKRTKGNKE